MSDFEEIISINIDECVQCEGCVENCPHDALGVGAGGIRDGFK